jgi:hypothetical protein
MDLLPYDGKKVKITTEVGVTVGVASFHTDEETDADYLEIDVGPYLSIFDDENILSIEIIN